MKAKNSNKRCKCEGNNKKCNCMNMSCSACESCNIIIIKEFDAFMNKHWKKSGDGKEITHTGMGGVRGCWTIPKEDYSEFIKLYKKWSRKNVDAYVERSPYIAPYYFDVDFHTAKSNRYYDEEFIKETIRRINNIVIKNFDVEENSTVLTAYVFEKYEPTEGKEDDYKDGFHIMYPELILDVPSRYFVYDKFMEILGKDNYVSDNIPHTNELGDIFDKSVIEANGVLMYGCAKEGRDPYKLTKVYNHSIKKILPDNCDDSNSENSDDSDSEKDDDDDQKEIMDWDDIIDVTAMRLHEDEPSHLIQPVTEKIKSKIQEIYETKYCKKTKQKETKEKEKNDEQDFDEKPLQNKKRKDNITEKDIKLAKELSKILSKKRATGYESWRNVGWALHNIDNSLYDSFIEFSKKAGKTVFDERGCKKLWENAKVDGYSLGSLRMWAMEDDPDEFDRVIADFNQDVLDKLATCTHDDVANYIHSLYKGIYVCTDIEKQEWYEFKNHRWHKIQKGSSLFERISDDIPNKILCAMNDVRRVKKIVEEEISKNKIKPENADYKSHSVRNSKGLIEKLKDMPYKKNIMEACRHKFFDPKFKEKLNSNVHLLGFENGVYSLKIGDIGFRDGIPEDYISFSVGYDYIKKCDKDYVKAIHKFFESCLPHEKVRKYVLRFMASCLDGTSKDQKFPFWIGTGGNGKSVAINMLQYAFGDYYSNMSTAYLTKRREGSSTASPDLADKVGKRIITFQETEKGEKIQVSKLKELCGNDTISARALYQEQMYFKPQAKYILATNKLPELEVDGGIRRRLRVIEWIMKYVDPEDFDKTNKRHVLKDNELDERIQEEEWKQNFMWMLINEIYPEYINIGLNEPDEVKNLSSDYMASNDKIGMFLNICTEKTENTSRVKLGLIYEEFQDFYKERYGQKPPNYEYFIEYLKGRDFRVEQKSKNNVYVYGLNLKEENEDDEEVQS